MLNVQISMTTFRGIRERHNHLQEAFPPRAISLEKMGFQIELRVVMGKLFDKFRRIGSIEKAQDFAIAHDGYLIRGK